MGTIDLGRFPDRPHPMDLDRACQLASEATGQTWQAVRMSRYWVFINKDEPAKGGQSARRSFVNALADFTGLTVTATVVPCWRCD